MPTPSFIPPNFTETWRDEAACSRAIVENEWLSDAWINEDSYVQTEATRICVEDCKVRFECAAYAVSANSGATGIYAGFYFSRGALPSPLARAFKRQTGLEARTRQRFRVTNNGEASEAI